MLWEFWGRHRAFFVAQGFALLAGFVVVQWLDAFSPSGREIFIPCAYQAGAFALLQTLTCFCYMEVDVRRQQGGIPGYLLLKPVSTLRLVALPMLSGGIAVVAVLLAWVGLVWRHIGFPLGQLGWSCAVAISFTWSVQATAWGFANRPWGVQAVLVLLAAAANAFIGFVPLLPVEFSPGWRLAALVAFLAGSFALACVGVRRVRQGAWEECRGRTAETQCSPRGGLVRFRSAFRAQFWLEWRRQGLTLPFFTGLGQLFIVLAQLALQLALGPVTGSAMSSDPGQVPYTLSALFLAPLVCSLMLGGLMIKFDLSHDGNELPAYIAVRPMTNGGFVLAKLAMAALTSALTWLVAFGMLLLWFLLFADAAWLGQLTHVARSKPAAIALAGCASWVTLVLLTWRNLVSGLWLGLCGRPKFVMGLNYLRFALYLGLFILGKQFWENLGSRATLLDSLTGILVAALVLKLAFSAAAFRWSLRHKTVTSGVIAWIVASWIGCGLFVSVVAGRICTDLHQPQAWLWTALAGFFLLPLAELALAPVALTWNRHR